MKKKQGLHICWKLTVMVLLLTWAVVPVRAQFTIDGKRPAYDSLTNTYLITVPMECFNNGTCRFPAQLDDSITWGIIGGVLVSDYVSFPVVNGTRTYDVTLKHNNVTSRSKLRFTYLPILQLEGTFSDEYVEGMVYYTAPEAQTTQQYNARIKWAGSSTAQPWYNKHHYHVKFVDENGDKMDVSFGELRSDNHWRLDAGIVDLLRIRNKVAHSLWADMATKPYYIESQPKARTYTRGMFMEVFLNNSYEGFYDMTEYLDRKQMKLKKYDETNATFHGMLWKAKDETKQTKFISTTTIDNEEEYWGGFEVKYPDIDDVCPTDFKVLSNAISFVQRSTDEHFAQMVGEFFDLPVLVDYYVFIQVILAIDNTCKNIIWGCYDSDVDKKLTLAVWDMDATVGQYWRVSGGHYHDETLYPENELDSVSYLPENRLFQRLLATTDFKQQALKRYHALRSTVLSPDSLAIRYINFLDELRQAGALDRESTRWSGDSDIDGYKLDFDSELKFVTEWLSRRIAYLDANLFVGGPGDLNSDGNVDITDVAILIDLLLNNPPAGINLTGADANQDGVVSVSDVTYLVDQLLY